MGLKEKTIKSLGWSFGARIFRQGVSFVITVILARLLTPDDFGLVGMVTVFTGFATIFGELGLSAALIQKQDIDDNHYSSAFWLNIASGILLTLILIGLSPFIAKFYNKPQLQPIIAVLSLNYIISSLSIVQGAIYKKEMNFKILSLSESISVVVSGVVGISLALRGYGVWSLVFQMTTFTFVNTIFLWFFSSWKPKFVFSLEAIKDIFNFSANVTGFNIVNYFARNMDYLLIGKFLGSEALGFYTLAYKLMMYPLQNITRVISSIMFPAFSSIQNDLKKVRNVYLKMIKAISLITFPMMFGLFAVAPEFINIVYGPKWEPVVLLIRILCVCGMVQSITSPVGNIILSQGKSGLYLKLGILGSIIVVPAVVLGLKWGIWGVALFYTLENFLWSLYIIHISNSLIKLYTRHFYKNLIESILMSSIMLITILIFKQMFHINHPMMLMINITCGIMVYLGLLFIFKELYFQSNRIIVDLLKTK